MTKSSLAQVTPSLEPSAVSDGGCPCGRSHPPHGVLRRRATKLADKQDLTEKVYEAFAQGKADREGSSDRWVIRYAGNCEKPIEMRRTAEGAGWLGATYQMRCRRCKACLRARTWYWALAGMKETKQASELGLRSWFGTLTFAPEAQRDLWQRAMEKWAEAHASTTEVPEWWNDELCDERFHWVREEVRREIQLYWKRLRKAGHKFRYLVVIERHKTGLPHVHYLLHEVEERIRKKDQQVQWPFGFVKTTIVGGRSRKAAAPDKAAWYVVKYLSKSVQARQMASQHYRPEARKRSRADTTSV